MTLVEKLFINIEKIKEDYNKNKNIVLLAEKYGCSSSTMSRFLTANNIHKKNSTNIKYSFLYNNIDSFKKDYIEGVISLNDLIEKYQAPKTALKSLARSLGIKRSGWEENIDSSKIINEYLTGKYHLSYFKEKYGITPSKLKTLLKHNNTSRLAPGEANRIYNFNEKILEKIDTEEKAYFLGFFYADGSVDFRKGVFSITIQKEDDYILKRFYKLFECDRKVYYCYNKKYQKEYARFYLTNKKVLNPLALKLGLEPNKTFKIKFPSDEIVPHHLKKHFVRGYFDGDGCFSLPKKDIRQSRFSVLGNKNFLEGMADFLEKETGLQFNIHQEGTIWSMAKSGTLKLPILMEYLYDNGDATIYLTRKYDKYLKYKKGIELKNGKHKKRKNE